MERTFFHKIFIHFDLFITGSRVKSEQNFKFTLQIKHREHQMVTQPQSFRWSFWFSVFNVYEANVLNACYF